MQNYDADLVVCSFVKGEKCCWEQMDNGVEIRENGDILGRMWENDVIVTVAWNKLYHNKFFTTHNLRYPEGKIHEDMFLTPQILALAKKMVINCDKLYFYRVRPNSIMTAKFSEKQLDILEAIKFRITFFESKGLFVLARKERESYLRKSCQMYLLMKKERKDQYKEKMKSLKKEIISGIFGLKSKVSIKERLKEAWMFCCRKECLM